MMWLPRSRYISAMPLRARLLLSVAPEVKMISLAVAPISFATCSRACSTACSAFPPEEWVRAGCFPQLRGEEGNHRFKHARIHRRGGVVIHVDWQLYVCRGRHCSLNGAHCALSCSRHSHPLSF